MGKLLTYFEQNSEKFLPAKHQNSLKTEQQHKQIIRQFIIHCESLGICHTKKINENVIAKYIKERLSNKSLETKRKHKIWLFIMYKKLNKREVRDYVKNL
jgi:hypothetical protein